MFFCDDLSTADVVQRQLYCRIVTTISFHCHTLLLEECECQVHTPCLPSSKVRFISIRLILSSSHCSSVCAGKEYNYIFSCQGSNAERLVFTPLPHVSYHWCSSTESTRLRSNLKLVRC